MIATQVICGKKTNPIARPYANSQSLGMYKLRPGIKKDPVRRWALPDRIFFGHGACHILAGTFLREESLRGFYAERIVPNGDAAGNHIYVTDGVITFDYHGFTTREKLLRHHEKTWSSQFENWSYSLEAVNFDLLSTQELNARKMLGPDQYLHDPVKRAKAFLAMFDHTASAGRVYKSLAAQVPANY